MKEYTVELTCEENKTCKLNFFLASLDYVREAGEFTTADLQRHLKCGYETAIRVLDALCLLNTIEKISGSPRPLFRSIF
jgi:hypothetical protein